MHDATAAKSRLLPLLLLTTLVTGCDWGSRSVSDGNNSGNSSPTNYGVLPIPAGTELIYRATGALQCISSGESLGLSAQRLIDAGIDVIASDCGFITGVMFPAVCGAGSASINLHLVPKQSVGDAQALGYKLASSLESADIPWVSYQVSTCPTPYLNEDPGLLPCQVSPPSGDLTAPSQLPPCTESTTP